MFNREKIREICGALSNGKKWKYCILMTAVLFLIANGFAVMNLAPQHDAINHVFAETLNADGTGWVMDPSHSIILGRFLRDIYVVLLGKIYVPWLGAVLTVVFLSVTVYLTADMLEMDDLPGIFIISASLVCNVCMTTMMAVFSWLSDPHCLAGSLAVLGVYLLRKKAGVLSDMMAVLLFVCSMGIYQAEIIFALIVLVLAFMKDVLRKKEILWKEILRWILVFAVSGVIYYAVYKGTMYLYGLTASSSYNDMSVLGQLSVSGVLHSLKAVGIDCVQFFFGSQCFVSGMRIIDICLLVIFVPALVMKLVHLPAGNKIMTVLCVIIVPVLGISMPVLMGLEETEFYCCPGLFLVYPGMAMVIRESVSELSVKKICRPVIIGLCGILYFQNAVYANGAYTAQNVLFERTENIMTLINADLLDLDDYKAGETEVVIVGYFVRNKTLAALPMEQYAELPGFSAMSVTYAKTWQNFTADYSVPMNVSIDQSLKEDVKDMPSFPDKGYMKVMDGKVIVKISD